MSRRPATSVAQVVALGLGLMALLLLTFVRTNLLDRWQTQLTKDAPNRFIINVQEDQFAPLTDFVEARGLVPPALYPLVRARFAGKNGEPVAVDRTPETEGSDDERDDRRRRDREFNLSMESTLRDDNTVTDGAFWGATRPATPEVSVEAEFATKMDWKLGDRLTFDIAGSPVEARLTSLREVDWESFRPNFLVVLSPGALDGFAASYITSVRITEHQKGFTAALVDRFPNLSVLDIDAALAQARRTADQVSAIVEVVFYFAMVAGLLVLIASVSASQDERLLEGGVMRVLGGSRRQLRLAQASEFGAIGLLSGVTASIAASLVAGFVARQEFDLPWRTDWKMGVAGAVAGVLAALGAGLWATRRVFDAPPSVTLREL